MHGKVLGIVIVAVALATTAAVHLSWSPEVQVTDSGSATVPRSPSYPAELAPVSAAAVKEFRIPIRDATIEIAKGVTYTGWTFGGSAPGPVVRVRQGDLVRIKLVNEASMPHSIDFHAARIPMNKAFQYQEHPLHVDVGDRVRLFVVNAGPSFTSDFHIVGTVFDNVYPDGDPRHPLHSVQTWGVPAGGGAVFETVFDRAASGEGAYAFVTHAFADAAKGAVGLIQVGAPQQ